MYQQKCQDVYFTNRLQCYVHITCIIIMACSVQALTHMVLRLCHTRYVICHLLTASGCITRTDKPLIILTSIQNTTTVLVSHFSAGVYDKYHSKVNHIPIVFICTPIQSMAAFVGFLTSTLITLQWVLLILVNMCISQCNLSLTFSNPCAPVFTLQTVLAVLGTMSFAIVEWRNYKRMPNLLIGTSVNKEDYNDHSDQSWTLVAAFLRQRSNSVVSVVICMIALLQALYLSICTPKRLHAYFLYNIRCLISLGQLYIDQSWTFAAVLFETMVKFQQYQM